MSFTSLLDQTVTFLERVSEQNEYNMDSFTIAATGSEYPCYLTKLGGSEKQFGKDVINYTHRMFTNYISGIEDSDYIAEVDGTQYEIKQIDSVFRNHHTEYLMSTVEDR